MVRREASSGLVVASALRGDVMLMRRIGLLGALIAGICFGTVGEICGGVVKTGNGTFNEDETPGNNNVLANAFSIDGNWSVISNSDIVNSTTVPHVSITGTADGSPGGTYDYYSFTVNANGKGSFDIDTSTGSPNTSVGVFSDNSTTFGFNFATNGDSPISNGAGGSVSTNDAYVEWDFTGIVNPTTFYVAVGGKDADPAWDGNGPLTGSAPYTLHVSLEGAAVPEPSSLALLLCVSGIGLVVRRKKRRENEWTAT